jgi:hypothetical protein
VSNFNRAGGPFILSDPKVAYNIRKLNHLIDSSFGLQRQATELSLAPTNQQSDVIEQEKPVVIQVGTPEIGPHSSNFIVGWESEDDPENPMNWSWMKKSVQIGLLSGILFVGYDFATIS